jgi:myosin-crossreactive antigen
LKGGEDMRIKIFVVQTIEKCNYDEIEKEVNDWLQANKDNIVEIKSITPSAFPCAMAITVVYLSR